MTNYLCINGKKTELTKEQMKQLGIVQEPIATISADGKIAKIGDYKFIVLKNNATTGTVELILENILGENTEFGENSDFKGSTVKKILDAFAEEIEKIVGAENLIEHNVDLTALDGLKEYGSTKAKMSLLTLAQYQEYVETLDEYKLDKGWGLATPYSTPKHGYKQMALCVSPGGVISSYYCDRNFGVRPFCILKSNIFNA